MVAVKYFENIVYILLLFDRCQHRPNQSGLQMNITEKCMIFG